MAASGAISKEARSIIAELEAEVEYLFDGKG